MNSFDMITLIEAVIWLFTLFAVLGINFLIAAANSVLFLCWLPFCGCCWLDRQLGLRPNRALPGVWLIPFISTKGLL